MVVIYVGKTRFCEKRKFIIAKAFDKNNSFLVQKKGSPLQGEGCSVLFF